MGMQGKVLWWCGPFLWKSGVPADVTGFQGEQQGKQVLHRMRNKEQRPLCLHVSKEKRVRIWSNWAAKREEKVMTQKLSTFWE